MHIRARRVRAIDLMLGNKFLISTIFDDFEEVTVQKLELVGDDVIINDTFSTSVGNEYELIMEVRG